MFQCLGWPCPATFILYLLFETPIVTLHLLAPRNAWCSNRCFGAQVSSKNGTWYSERSERAILQFMCVCCWAGVTYLRYRVLTSPKKGETAVHCCVPTLSVLVMLMSRNVFHVESALQSIVWRGNYAWLPRHGKVKSAYEPSGPSGRSLSRFLLAHRRDTLSIKY